MIVHTIGHSVLSIADLLGLLAAHGIRNVADVRRYPASRRHPHFEREALAAALAEVGVAYRWLAGLGGRRSGRRDSPHVAWQSASFRAYADHMESAEFRRELDELIELARTGATTVMCAEAVPWRCHRQLIADALVARGIDVRHIIGHGDPQEHRLTPFARLEGERVVYDRGQLGLAGAARLSAPDAIGHNPRHRR